VGPLIGGWIGFRHGWRGVRIMAAVLLVMIGIGSLIGPPSDNPPITSTPTSSTPIFWPANSSPSDMCAQDGGVMAGQRDLPAQVPAGGQVTCSDGSNQNVQLP
jgi:MFS family permease